LVGVFVDELRIQSMHQRKSTWFTEKDLKTWRLSDLTGMYLREAAKHPATGFYYEHWVSTVGPCRRICEAKVHGKKPNVRALQPSTEKVPVASRVALYAICDRRINPSVLQFVLPSDPKVKERDSNAEDHMEGKGEAATAVGAGAAAGESKRGARDSPLVDALLLRVRFVHATVDATGNTREWIDERDEALWWTISELKDLKLARDDDLVQLRGAVYRAVRDMITFLPSRTARRLEIGPAGVDTSESSDSECARRLEARRVEEKRKVGEEDDELVSKPEWFGRIGVTSSTRTSPAVLHLPAFPLLTAT